MMRIDDLDFDLPPELIAQEPSADRAASRLLCYRKSDRAIEHRVFADLPSLLNPGDLLVFNDARVIPARFALRRSTGGRVEGLFLAEESPGVWRALLKNVGHAWASAELHFADRPDVGVRIIDKLEGGEYRIAVEAQAPALEFLAKVGRMPLPPYIKRQAEHDARDESDRQRYQTVYASTPGSVAAPTAGLHFTPDLLAALDARGIERCFVTLHVGMGTFKPITADTLEGHAMHEERYTISDAAAAQLTAAKREDRRIIPVGTTAARVLESQPAGDAIAPVADGRTSIFIYPPYMWKHVAGMVTNFHLPRSTLIALVAALVGLDEQRQIYAEAIARRYRFFSYGDAMVVL